MIFMTVGTTKFPFDRLLKAVDEVMLKLQTKEELIVQKGETNYQFKYPKTQVFKEIPFDKMISYLKKARVVVTHGGPATIFLALKHSRNKPLVVPRYKDAGDHVDNHQVFFSEFLKKKGLIEAVFPQENLVERIKNYMLKPKSLTKNKKYHSSKENLVEKLVNYTQSLKKNE